MSQELSDHASVPDQDDCPFKLRLYVPDNPEIRSITWQRTIDMYGTIELDLDATWEQVDKALAEGCYYWDDDDGLIHVFEDDFVFVAVIRPSQPTEAGDTSFGQCTDDGFVLGDDCL